MHVCVRFTVAAQVSFTGGLLHRLSSTLAKVPAITWLLATPPTCSPHLPTNKLTVKQNPTATVLMCVVLSVLCCAAPGFFGTSDSDADALPQDEALLVGPVEAGHGERWCTSWSCAPQQ
jgi:hypothetical protein